MRPVMRAAGVGAALAGLMLTVVGCSQALPLGPSPAAPPAPSRLASVIVMQPGVTDLGASVSKCPAGSVALSGPGATGGPLGGTGPVSSPSNPGGVCFRTLGKPVTFTTAGVVVAEQQARSPPAPQPASWVVRINLPAAEAAELAAVTTRLAGTQDQLAIIIAGQTVVNAGDARAAHRRRVRLRHGKQESGSPSSAPAHPLIQNGRWRIPGG